MTRFMVAYIFLIIGFMMSFIILFADQDPFQSFPGFFVKVKFLTTDFNSSCSRFFVKVKFLSTLATDFNSAFSRFW